MLRVFFLALLLAPLAAAQPLTTSEPLAVAALRAPEIMPVVLAPEASVEQLRVALVVQRAAADGSGCGGGGSDCGGGDSGCSGADCSGLDFGTEIDGTICVVAIGACTVGAGYGLWRLIKRRRGPKEDTLGTASPMLQTLASGLGSHVEIVPPSREADVTLTVRETTRWGVGMASEVSRLEITARDRAGRPLALDDGPIPSLRLVLAMDGTLPERLDRLASHLAR